MTIAWSYSRLSDFENCPLLFKHKYILKTIKFVPNAATERGSKLHKQLERNVVRAGTGQAPVGDPEVLAAHPIIEAFVEVHPQIFIEDKMAFTKRMRPTGYFDKDVWLRAVFDLGGLSSTHNAGGSASILDWKTGQYRPNKDQVLLYNMCALKFWDQIESVTSALVFIDHKKSAPPVTTTRDQLADLIDEFSDRAEAIQIAEQKDDWPAQKYWGCRFCGVNDCRYVKR